MSDEAQSERPQDIVGAIGGFLPRIPKLYAGDQIKGLLGIAAFVDGAIVRIISAYFASDKAKAIYLADNIVDKMSMDRKLKVLEYALRENAWEGEFPDLISQLRKLFALRNELAHSYIDDEVGQEGEDLVFTRYSWRDGDYKEDIVSLSAIANANETAQKIILEALMTIVFRVEPERGR